MEDAIEGVQWFMQVVPSSWILAPWSLFCCLALLWWRRQRSTATILRTAAIGSHATGVPLLHHARPQLAQQLAHARRYERPLTAVVWSLEKDEPVKSQDRWSLMEHNGGIAPQQQRIPATLLSFFLVGSILRDAVRESDIITYDALHDQYVVLFPELTKPQALRATRRLNELLCKRTRLQVRAGAAAFPDDGLTMEILITNARTAGTQQLVGEAPSEATGQTGRQRPRGVPLVKALDSTWAEKRGE